MATQATTRRRSGARELRGLRDRLQQHLAELRTETDHATALMADLQRTWQDEPAGDQVDAVARTFDWQRETTAVDDRRHRMQQMEHALERLADGTYGWCEKCGKEIPTDRLQAFPAATLCVACKTKQERH